MKTCETCEFGECDWPDCELSSPAVDTHHPDYDPSIIMMAWAAMVSFSLAIFGLIAWMVF